MGSRRAGVFVATDVLLFAETLGAEEALRGWLAQHGVQMAPKEKIPMGPSGRDGVETIASAKARDDGRNDER